MGIHPGSPASMFLRTIVQLETYKHPITTPLAPIEYIAPLLQAVAISFATDLDLHSERVFSYGVQGADELSLVWRQNQRDSHTLERIVQTLSNGLSALEWSQGVSTRIEQLHQEHITLLQSSRSLSQNIKDSLQQTSSLQSIKETQKGLQQADSVRR